MIRKALLVCGIVYSLLYVGTDIIGAMRYEGYNYTSQAISELTAIGAPAKPLLEPLYITQSVLMIAFGVGVWGSTSRKRGLRVTGGLLVGMGIFGLVAWPFFPMHIRGTERTLTDTMHIIVTSVSVLSILLAIGFGANAFRKWFRLFSIGTILVLVVFGALSGMDAPRIEANLPTPWLGVTERINVGGYLLWVLVLAIVLLREGAAAPSNLGGRRDSG